MYALPSPAPTQSRAPRPAFSPPAVRAATPRVNLQSYAQAAFYAFHQDGLTFGINQLTGRSQSLADKSGWLVNAAI